MWGDSAVFKGPHWATVSQTELTAEQMLPQTHTKSEAPRPPLRRGQPLSFTQTCTRISMTCPSGQVKNNWGFAWLVLQPRCFQLLPRVQDTNSSSFKQGFCNAQKHYFVFISTLPARRRESEKETLVSNCYLRQLPRHSHDNNTFSADRRKARHVYSCQDFTLSLQV